MKLNCNHSITVRIRDSDKLHLVMVVCFRLEPILSTASAASENTTCFKSGQKRLKNNHLSLSVDISDTLCGLGFY